MQDLHHSDILTYALTRMASEFARDKQGVLKDLQRCIDETDQRRRLGGSRRDDFDDAGPGYSIETPHLAVESEDDKVYPQKTS